MPSRRFGTLAEMLAIRADMGRQGFTLIELIAVIAIVALISAIAVPGYQAYVQRANNAEAIADIMTLGGRIEIFRLRNQGRLPDDLERLDYEIPLDPWGRPYEYLVIEGKTGKSNVRKDKNLNPLNSDYDLYSKNPDGASTGPLSAKSSRDDILRANNGAFVGLAADY